MSYDIFKNVQRAERGVNLDLSHVANRQHALAGDGQAAPAKRPSNRIRISKIEQKQHDATFDAVWQQVSCVAKNSTFEF